MYIPCTKGVHPYHFSDHALVISITHGEAMAPIIKAQAQRQLAALEGLPLFQQLPELDDISEAKAVPVAPVRILPIDELAHTTDHDNCPACKAFDAALQVSRKNIASLTFIEARDYWAMRRVQDTGIKPGTHERDDAYMEALAHFFGPLHLRDITPGHLRSYQLARSKNSMRTDRGDVKPWKRRAENSTINHELALLGRILGHCRLWKTLKEYYFPLPVPKWSPREIMTEEEEERFFLDGARYPQAQLAYWVACLTNNTTASGSELRFLHLKHIFLRPAREISEIYISPEGVKKESRPRRISLNRTARWAVQQLYRRALQLGCADPDDFLFPFWIHPGKYDPTRPASKTFLRKSWACLLAATGHPELKPHDLRHNCITRLLEEGNDPETVRSIAGHLRPEMTEYYSHQRKRVKYEALKKIDPARDPGSKPPQKERRRVQRMPAPKASESPGMSKSPMEG
jgi:integrase